MLEKDFTFRERPTIVYVSQPESPSNLTFIVSKRKATGL